jgi:3-oxocholest-4-en-26-oate---CoA ligase
MPVWSHANLWEPIAKAQPNAPAFIQGDRVVTWKAFDDAADALAADFIRAGLSKDAKVAAYLYNCPEYMIAYYAAFKAGVAPINTNYRYGPEELHYLFENADAEAIVFHTGFADKLEQIRHRLPTVKRWIAIREPGHDVPDWAADYEKIVSGPPPNERPVRAPWGVSNDDLLLLYTGGTTGMPKGVMWRQEDWFGVYGFGGNPVLNIPALEAPEDAAKRLDVVPRPIVLVAAPLMHGTGQFSALAGLNSGGACVLLPSRKFDPIELWSEVERTRATRIIIVGLAFCAPMLDTLEANPGRWDISCVLGIVSSGAMWSYENKQALLKHMPQAALTDSFGSSEAVGLGVSVSTLGGEAQTAKFVMGPNTAVFKEDGTRVAPGSGERGLVAITGYLPLGYYKDKEKTDRTFMTFEGKRWSVPGDWAEVNEDGTLNLLGRGSVCINTGGEKVFPEEVEEALKRHPAVRDACVVGLPDPRFGERICAVVELQPRASEPSLPELAAHVKDQLSDYKAPRNLVIVDSVGRAPNGKLDYAAIKALAKDRVGAA